MDVGRVLGLLVGIWIGMNLGRVVGLLLVGI